MSGPKPVGGLGTATPLEAALVKAGAPAGGGCRDPGAGPPKADGPYICPYMPLHCQGEGKQGAKPGGPAGPPKKCPPADDCGTGTAGDEDVKLIPVPKTGSEGRATDVCGGRAELAHKVATGV